jgi:hypothetical protein
VSVLRSFFKTLLKGQLPSAFVGSVICKACLAPALLLLAACACAQNNYEIQVYGADTVAPKSTMVELHSNFTVDGARAIKNSTLGANALYPTNHVEHETVEITTGINDWSEVGFYVFTAERSGQGVQWVGDHIRPRVRAPDQWHWPVGASLSTEFGYQRRDFSSDTWTMELRPIIDKQLGRWYLATNLAVDRSFHGTSVPMGVTFAPAGKVGYDFSKAISAGFEYYADYGDIVAPDTLHNQQQQIFAVTDLNVSPQWEINFGVGIGPTAGTDHLIVKGILGRHFDWTHHRAGMSDSIQ